MKGIQFTLEEKQLLVEALLFTACTDVCSDHTDAHRAKMLQLAEALNWEVGKLHNIYLYKNKDLLFEDPDIANKLLNNFKNIPVTEIVD